jgi:alpha,alpha-trehalose phosphorylase
VLVESRVFPDGGLVTAATVLEPGQKLRVIKFVAYGSSSERSLTAVRDQAWAALSAAKHSGWDGLLAEQRAYLDDFWDRAGVDIDGDTEIQQAVRFALFHVLQAGARAETKPIPAKGLTGPGYPRPHPRAAAPRRGDPHRGHILGSRRPAAGNPAL